MESLVSQPDLLIVLGKNLGAHSKPPYIADRYQDHLSQESRMNVLAAGELWLKQPGVSDILFSTGPTNGEGIPAEAALMLDYFKRKFPGIPERYLSTEEKSHDTPTNAEEVAEMLDGTDYKNIALVSVGYHLKRAQTLFRRNGVCISETFPSEEVIRERSPRHYPAYTEKWRRAKRIRFGEQPKEFLLWAELAIDKRGKFPQKVTSRTRL